MAHEDLWHVVDEAPPEDTVDARIRLERLHAVIMRLPFKTQQIFVLNRLTA